MTCDCAKDKARLRHKLRLLRERAEAEVKAYNGAADQLAAEVTRRAGAELERDRLRAALRDVAAWVRTVEWRDGSWLAQIMDCHGLAPEDL